VLGLFAEKFMRDSFSEGKRDEPSLAFMTEKALALLDNSNGFFLMVESGQIDFASHHNDAGWVLREMLRLNSVIKVVEEFVSSRNDTLVILTADHETGGFGLSYRSSQVTGGQALSQKSAPPARGSLDFLNSELFSKLRAQKAPLHQLVESAAVETIPDVRKKLLSQTGVNITEVRLGQILGEKHPIIDDATSPLCEDSTSAFAGFYPYREYGVAARLGREIGAHQGVVWASGAHTATPVQIFSKGPQSQRFAGWLQTRDVGRQLLTVVTDK
jgi:alkaline phosphatase